MGATLTLAGETLRPAPRAHGRWRVNQSLSLSVDLARLHQYAQSLRNSESLAGNVFPVDLFLGAGSTGIPVARSDQAVVSAEYRPTPGLLLGPQVYVKNFRNLLLVAPVEGGPFSTGGFSVGSGLSRGAALEGAFSSRRFGLIGSYGWQSVKLESSDQRFVPEWGSAHKVEAGVILFPSASSSVRVGATGEFGRRTTAVAGTLEWEACNLLDEGCEFGGNPDLGDEPRGGSTLPAYLRVDLTVRNHWHFSIARRDARLSLFGTVTNLLGRKNLLTFATDPGTGERIGVEMRPFSPLVLGLDVSF
jgi:hypothetical protein